MSDAEKLARDFQRAAQQVKPKIRATVFKGALNVKKRAQDLAPKRYKTNAESINFEVDDLGDEIVADIETRSGFGAILEFGTPTNPAGRPYMLPALRTEGPGLERYVNDIVDGLLP